MDMKKILQALDGAATKPVEGASDMKKFVQIVNEGANPHKVSLPVQMAMQHYQSPKPVTEKKQFKTNGLLHKYLESVEQEEQQRLEEKRETLRMYSKKIADRVLVKEAAMPVTSPVAQPVDTVDTITTDVPLLIRLLEYAREDAKTDMDLHNVTDRLIKLSKEVEVLTMQHYDNIMGGQPTGGEEEPAEVPVAEACWKNYKQIGMKKKGGKTVPNCVPKK